jgi:hypothetical protein
MHQSVPHKGKWRFCLVWACYLISFLIVEGITNEVSSPDPGTGPGGRKQQNKCVEDVMTNNNAIYSTMVRSGKTTYFVDVKEAKNGNKYLSISENRLEGEEKKRTTLRVFGETVDQFRQAIDEAAAAVAQ